MNMLDHSSYSTRNRVISTESQSLGLVWKKLNLSQQKHALMNQKKCTTTQNKHKKLKPGLVTFYNIRPGNKAGLFSRKG